MDLETAIANLGIDDISQAKLFFDESAPAFFEVARWPHGVSCTSCGSTNVSKDSSRERWSCYDCQKQFAHKTDTFMHGTRPTLAQWGLVCWVFFTGAKISNDELKDVVGVSGPEIQRMIAALVDFEPSEAPAVSKPVGTTPLPTVQPASRDRRPQQPPTTKTTFADLTLVLTNRKQEIESQLNHHRMTITDLETEAVSIDGDLDVLQTATKILQKYG